MKSLCSGPILSDTTVGGRPAPRRQTALAKLPPRPGVLLTGARRGPLRPLVAGQALARVTCCGSGPDPASHVLTLVPAARPCPQDTSAARMEPEDEEHHPAEESTALGGALRARLAASFFLARSNSPLPPRTALASPGDAVPQLTEAVLLLSPAAAVCCCLSSSQVASGVALLDSEPSLETQRPKSIGPTCASSTPRPRTGSSAPTSDPNSSSSS